MLLLEVVAKLRPTLPLVALRSSTDTVEGMIGDEEDFKVGSTELGIELLEEAGMAKQWPRQRRCADEADNRRPAICLTDPVADLDFHSGILIPRSLDPLGKAGPHLGRCPHEVSNRYHRGWTPPRASTGRAAPRDFARSPLRARERIGLKILNSKFENPRALATSLIFVQNLVFVISNQFFHTLSAQDSRCPSRVRQNRFFWKRIMVRSPGNVVFMR